VVDMLLLVFDNTHISVANLFKKATATGDGDNNSGVWGFHILVENSA